MQKVADALPGFGIVAAVLGIVNTMGAIEGAETAKIGQKVGAALVGHSSAFSWRTVSSGPSLRRWSIVRTKKAKPSRS